MNRIWFEVTFGIMFIAVGTMLSSQGNSRVTNDQVLGTTELTNTAKSISSAAVPDINTDRANTDKITADKDEFNKKCIRFLDSLASESDAKILQRLNQERPLLTCKDDSDKNILFYLVEARKYSLVEKLIDRQWVDVDSINNNNENILFYIFEEAPTKFITKILKKSKKLDLVSKDSENTVLTVLAGTNRKDLDLVVQTILKIAPQLKNKKNKLGDTALSIAKENNNKTLIKLLSSKN